MERVSRYKTLDGKEHPTQLVATVHAECAYGEALSRLVHQLLQVERPNLMREFIEENLRAFIELKALKDDIWLKNPPQEEDNGT